MSGIFTTFTPNLPRQQITETKPNFQYPISPRKQFQRNVCPQAFSAIEQSRFIIVVENYNILPARFRDVTQTLPKLSIKIDLYVFLSTSEKRTPRNIYVRKMNGKCITLITFNFTVDAIHYNSIGFLIPFSTLLAMTSVPSPWRLHTPRPNSVFSYAGHGHRMGERPLPRSLLPTPCACAGGDCGGARLRTGGLSPGAHLAQCLRGEHGPMTNP